MSEARRTDGKFLDAFEAAIRPFIEDVDPCEVPRWDDYFVAIAHAVALRSKDSSRKVGAVVVGQGHVILSTGYNWLPRGVRELPERTASKQEKYRWVTHAEANAIFNAARCGTRLDGSTLYVTTFPCTLCAQAIVQANIREVFTYGEFWVNDPNDYRNAAEILAEARIHVNAPRIRSEDNRLRDEERKREQQKKEREQAKLIKLTPNGRRNGR